MELSIQHYFANSPEFKYRVGPVWAPCRNFAPAKEAWKYVDPMTKLLKEAGGLGLAANQVGLDIPLFILKLGKEYQPCYRPRILKDSGKYYDAVEACLSFPGAALMVPRHTWVEVDFIAKPNNQRLSMTLHGIEARAFQHEFDHLNGITIFHQYTQNLSELKTSEQVEEKKSPIITEV